MDARIKSGHDEGVCVHTNLNFKQPRRLRTQLHDLAAHPREFCF
jgi:hypothetical protein